LAGDYSLAAASCFNYFFIPRILPFSVAAEQDRVAPVSFQVRTLVANWLPSREQRMERNAAFQREIV
jgi:hypothetical protein